MIKKKILITDDDEDIRAGLSDLLKFDGYDVLEAAGGEEALLKARLEKPDLILLDTLMPGMDGIEACRRIKQVENIPAKVIVYTAKMDAIDAVRAREFGVDDYCIKGENPEFLLRAIKGILAE